MSHQGQPEPVCYRIGENVVWQCRNPSNEYPPHLKDNPPPPHVRCTACDHGHSPETLAQIKARWAQIWNLDTDAAP